MRDVYAVVTGASSGLGFEFAKQLSAKGYKIILVARRRGKLEQVQKILGHSQIDTTMQYAIVNQANVKTSHQKYIA